MFCCKDVLCWRMDQPFWFVAAVRLAMSEHTKPNLASLQPGFFLTWSNSVAASTSNNFFTHLKGCCHGICWFTPLDITWHLFTSQQDVNSNGSSARESRWVPGKWSIWIKHGKFMKIMENREVRIHPISRVIYSYLNYMGINMGKTSKFPDESTATTPQEAPWNWKSFWRRCWKCCVNMSCWLMSSGVIVILNIIYCVCHTYYIYVLWCNMYIILGSIINSFHLLFWYLTMTYHCIPCNDDHLIHSYHMSYGLILDG